MMLNKLKYKLMKNKYIFPILFVIGVILFFSINALKKIKRKRVAENASEVLGAKLDSNKDFFSDAKNLYTWLGNDSKLWFGIGKVFNGKDAEIVTLLSKYNRLEFIALSDVYLKMYMRDLLKDLDFGISPFEFNKIKNIFQK